jgi:ribosomal protein S18 acetylase RimI-like enzyme
VCVAPAQCSQGLGTELIRFAEERIFRRFPNVFMCVSSL